LALSLKTTKMWYGGRKKIKQSHCALRIQSFQKQDERERAGNCVHESFSYDSCGSKNDTKTILTGHSI
jgi:hypothetical protein